MPGSGAFTHHHFEYTKRRLKKQMNFSYGFLQRCSIRLGRYTYSLKKQNRSRQTNRRRSRRKREKTGNCFVVISGEKCASLFVVFAGLGESQVSVSAYLETEEHNGKANYSYC
ncbi:MAG: hypothetical protein DRQ02_03315 [Candidatus Latescibacterota bacterium]|nr:MAG: hypothetical protein DRQ02_03315 [Candidatus Latescibacterota bacterium]RKY74259.1 MAG: hypothetical protein DRQ24_00185 [Candidatus Latescibacterota bacterium]